MTNQQIFKMYSSGNKIKYQNEIKALPNNYSNLFHRQNMITKQTLKVNVLKNANIQLQNLEETSYRCELLCFSVK